MSNAQTEALKTIRETCRYEIHKVVENDDGTLLLHHVGKGRERGTIRIRQWTMNANGGLTTIA